MADAVALLARIAAIRPPPAVRVYLLDRGSSWWTWLCGRHLAKRKADGWVVKDEKDPPHDLTCDDHALFACGEEMQP